MWNRNTFGTTGGNRQTDKLHSPSLICKECGGLIPYDGLVERSNVNMDLREFIYCEKCLGKIKEEKLKERKKRKRRIVPEIT